MNINHHVYEVFETRLQRLINESGLTGTALAAKIGVGKSTVSKYLSGDTKPTIETLINMADCFDVTVDYLLCRRSAVLSMHAPKDGIHIYEENEFDFKLLASEYDNFLAAMIDESNLNETTSTVISQITLLISIHLRDSASIYKCRHDITEEQFSAFYIRSGEIHKILDYLFSRLSLDVIYRSGMKKKFTAADLDLKSSIAGLIDLFAARSEALHSAMLDNMLLTLEHSVTQANRPPGRPALN
jgi:transcriptional regulator with XRE-family HTH domain